MLEREGMAKALSTVIGVDLGRHAIKAVVLERKSGDRWVLADYAWEAMGEGENGVVISLEGMGGVERRMGRGGEWMVRVMVALLGERVGG